MPEGLGVKRKHDDDDSGEREAEEQEQSEEPAAATSPPPVESPSSVPTVADAPLLSSLGSRLLAKAGYKGEGGLGKREQGAASLLPENTQLSTHGIGFQTAAKRQRHTYTPQDHISIRITPHYLPPPATPLYPTDLHPTLAPYADTQQQLTSPNYAPLALQEQLQECKCYFDHIDHRSFLAARQRSNPFELIKGEMFQNRAALKMAELDTITDRLFTSLPAGSAPTALFHFADICAGPGGFSEYMLTRWKWRAKGYGFTLRTPPATDFLPHKFNSNAPAHSFRAYYGADGTGDITSTANVRRLVADVRAEVGDGVHVCMADGGFDVTGAESKQQMLSQQLILCECIAALSLVREGGHFACKLFDCFLPFTVSLLWVMWRCWAGVALVKPNQSRPANSERFLICRGRKGEEEVSEWRQYLVAVNEMIEEQKAQRKSSYAATSKDSSASESGRREEEKEEEVRGVENGEQQDDETADAEEAVDEDMAVWSVVPEEVVMADAEFMAYMRQSNEEIAQRQIAALTRIRQYVEDPNLPADDQQQIRLDCLRFWDITDARQQRRQRALSAQQRDRRSREDGDAAEHDEAKAEVETEAERVGYVHFDPQWGHCHFARHPQQGLFTWPAAEQLLPQLDEQLHSFLPLEPLPSGNEQDAYRREEVPSGVRQFHSFCDHRWQCLVIPTGGVHSFVLATSSGPFLLDDRMQPMPLPRSYPVTLPPDTLVECLLYPTLLLCIDAWSLPSPPSLFPSHRWLAGERSTIKRRLQEVALLLEAVRAKQGSGSDGGVAVAVGQLRSWSEVSESELDGGSDVLFVREEGKRPSVMRCWDERECGMRWPDVQRMMREVAAEKERARQRKIKQVQTTTGLHGEHSAVVTA